MLVDESHRSQYGSAHAKMRQVLPHACYIGFTGTPLLKAEKSTAAKFGGFIHSYSMRRAVEDKAVVPLLYEGRMAELDVDQGGIDKWFERVTQGLTDEQRADLKRKFSRAEAISAAEQRVKQIAYDLSDHFSRNFGGTGFKAQLATASKALALKYKRYLDEFGLVTSTVVISPPDTREGNEEVDEAKTPEVEAFWKRMMERYRTEEAYIREIKEDFGRADGVEVLIVVDKLLVGFDEPRNTVLYVDKPLKEHALLQAIARVNRLYEGKDFGYVIDYRGVLGELNAAMQTYNALEGYDSADIAGTITDVSAEIARLPGLHSELWAIFNPVPNKQDVEALQRFLAPEDLRQEFYDALTAYAKTLGVALGAVAFHNDTPPDPGRDVPARPALLPRPAAGGQAALRRNRGLPGLRAQGGQAAGHPHPVERRHGGHAAGQHLRRGSVRRRGGPARHAGRPGRHHRAPGAAHHRRAHGARSGVLQEVLQAD